MWLLRRLRKTEWVLALLPCHPDHLPWLSGMWLHHLSPEIIPQCLSRESHSRHWTLWPSCSRELLWLVLRHSSLQPLFLISSLVSLPVLTSKMPVSPMLLPLCLTLGNPVDVIALTTTLFPKYLSPASASFRSRQLTDHRITHFPPSPPLPPPFFLTRHCVDQADLNQT